MHKQGNGKKKKKERKHVRMKDRNDENRGKNTETKK
jgi:hypothetical protein